MPKAICRPNSAIATTKYQYATCCERYLIGSLKRGEVGHELVDLLRLQVLAVGVGHEGSAAGRKHRARHQVRARRDDRLADVGLHVLRLALVVCRADHLLRARADAGGRSAPTSRPPPSPGSARA